MKIIKNEKIKNYFISSNIKYLRESNNILQGKLARDLSVDQSTIAKWESGDREPSLEYIYKLCEYFNIKMGDILTLDLKYNDLPECDRVQIDIKNIEIILKHENIISNDKNISMEEYQTTIKFIKNNKDILFKGEK